MFQHRARAGPARRFVTHAETVVKLYKRSTTPAIAWPKPMHIAAMP